MSSATCIFCIDLIQSFLFHSNLLQDVSMFVYHSLLRPVWPFFIKQYTKPGFKMTGSRFGHSSNRKVSASNFVVKYSGKKGGALAEEINTKVPF